MRKTAISPSGKLKINVVAGTCVVLIGIGLKKAHARNILGFAIHRTDHARSDEGKWLEGMKVFKQSTASAGELVSTRDFPVQGFLWQDFTARPGTEYTYRVVALKGQPGALVEHAGLDVACKIKTEAEAGPTHSVWFNRGIAGSQAYARKFGTATPASVGTRAEKMAVPGA